jgi:hypothetical protein
LNVFLHGSDGQPPPAHHVVIMTPAAHLAGQELPSEFVEADGKPRNFEIMFVHGKAEVPDVLGKYMIEHKLAEKTRLIIPGAYN